MYLVLWCHKHSRLWLTIIVDFSPLFAFCFFLNQFSHLNNNNQLGTFTNLWKIFPLTLGCIFFFLQQQNSVISSPNHTFWMFTENIFSYFWKNNFSKKKNKYSGRKKKKYKHKLLALLTLGLLFLNNFYFFFQIKTTKIKLHTPQSLILINSGDYWNILKCLHIFFSEDGKCYLRMSLENGFLSVNFRSFLFFTINGTLYCFRIIHLKKTHTHT